MDCEFIRKNLIDITESTLPKEVQKEVLAHLESCNRCANLTGRFAQLWQVWQNPVPMDSSPAFWFQLQRRIRESDERKVSVLPLLLAPGRVLRPVAVAAVLVIGAFMGHYLGNFPAPAGTDLTRLENAQEVEQYSSESEALFDYYFGGLDESPTGSVVEFYVNPEQNG